MASRIFVKNLPPNLKEEDFRKHFSSLAPVTDVKFISKRRIGYVGYKSAETAETAVKYYNKSFIRMSKINVEIARAADEVQPRKKARYGEIESTQNRITPKGGEKSQDPKLQEFLSAMAPSSKSKTWANEDGLDSSDRVVPVIPSEDKTEDDSDDEYQTIAKKRKHEDVEAPDGDLQAKSVKHELPVGDIPPANSTDDVEFVLHDADENQVSEEKSMTVATTSDSDWLRSKTSRLLGLVDDDDLDESSSHVATRRDDRAMSEDSNLEKGGKHNQKQQADEDPEDQMDIDSTTIKSTTDDSSTGRLFLRNLSYETTETDLERLFAKHGLVDEVHVSKDTRSGISKGFGYVQFNAPAEAEIALKALDGKSFQGRLLHILPARAKNANGLDEYEISKLSLKKQREIRRKAEASTATFKWNSMYMNQDAILSSVANRLGVSKTDVLDPTSSDAAVKQAHAETSVIKETKSYFQSHGVNLDSFKGKEYSDRAILVKNFPYGTSAEELKKMFEVYGAITRLLMPPSATIAIVEMEQATQARSAFSSLAYRKFKDSVLFLEKAPKMLFNDKAIGEVDEELSKKPSTSELLVGDEASTPPSTTSTLFVRNLNFSTTSRDLRDLFMPLTGFLSATVKTKTDPKKPGQTLSMGFGFIEFRGKDEALSAMAAMNGHKLEGHELIIKESNKALDAAEERRKEDAAKKLAAQRTKIIIRNLPFEATKKDVRALFGPYGQLRTVRVPKKFDSTSRGFAFAEFVTTREAENAMKSLTGIHLLGRRLNFEYAAADTIDAEEEIEKMSKKISKQADKVAIQNLTGSGRKKFSVRQGEDEIID